VVRDVVRDGAADLIAYVRCSVPRRLSRITAIMWKIAARKWLMFRGIYPAVE
jgi:hypothetical protein